MTDVRPVFLKTDDVITLSEETPIATQVYLLSANHFHETIMYVYNNSKVSEGLRKKFKLTPVAGLVQLEGERLDYEKQATYDLYYYALNLRNPRFTSNEFHLRLIVADSNDNAPVFTSQNYQFSVPENVNVGTLMGRVTATDADGTSPNNGVAYFLMNDEAKAMFSVNTATGRITTTGKLDHETRNEYVLTICARDGATMSRQGCTLVTITVTDVNEGLPTFAKSTYRVEISETSPRGFRLFEFSATDIDKTPVTYELDTTKTSADARAAFTLNSNNGELLLNAAKLDFDVKSKYSLYVLPVEDRTGRKGAECLLEVVVIEAATPVCRVAFQKDLFIMTVQENAAIGTSIGSISASYVPTTCANQGLRYHLLSSQHRSKFVVSSTTGVVTVAEGLDFEKEPAKFTLTACADDVLNSQQAIGRLTNNEMRLFCFLTIYSMEKVSQCYFL